MQVDRKILPSELGGSNGGTIDNSECLAKMARLDGYFVSLSKSRRRDGGNEDSAG